MDDDLARRLIALRHSLDSQNTAPITPLKRNEDALAARFEKILNKSPLSKANQPTPEVRVAKKSYEEVLSVEELVNALSSEKEAWAFEKSDENEIEQLLAEAKTAIPPKINLGNDKREPGQEITPDWLRVDPLEIVRSDTNAEEDILKMIKDEIDFESAHGIVPNEHDDNELPRNERARSSTPMHADLDEDLLRRFDALGGLELPPVPKMDPRVKSRPPTELDETDTWCCICNDDAEYRCSDCENDIYCASCLYEAHTGPSAGYEERRHKWTEYTKPKKSTSC